MARKKSALKWVHMARDLKVGEVIRTKLGKKGVNKDYLSKLPKNWDGYMYARAGGGFGMMKNTLGNAIFVSNECWTYEDARDRKVECDTRWERYWGIEHLADEETKKDGDTHEVQG